MIISDLVAAAFDGGYRLRVDAECLLARLETTRVIGIPIFVHSVGICRLVAFGVEKRLIDGVAIRSQAAGLDLVNARYGRGMSLPIVILPGPHPSLVVTGYPIQMDAVVIQCRA